jgi:exodeoxyribonuclease VII small subunit
MSKTSKTAAAPATPDQPFEAALQKLETIVEEMESGDLPLDALLQRFEEGTRLAQQCQSKLGEAELKVQQLEKNAAGKLALQPVADEN